VRATAGMDLSRLDQAFEFEKETSQHAAWWSCGMATLIYEKYFAKQS